MQTDWCIDSGSDKTPVQRSKLAGVMIEIERPRLKHPFPFSTLCNISAVYNTAASNNKNESGEHWDWTLWAEQDADDLECIPRVTYDEAHVSEKLFQLLISLWQKQVWNNGNHAFSPRMKVRCYIFWWLKNRHIGKLHLDDWYRTVSTVLLGINSASIDTTI